MASLPADTLQEGYDSEEADHSKLGPPGATAYLAEADPYDGARAAFEYNPKMRDAWLKFDCTTVRECQVSTGSCERLLSLRCVFTPTALCLQSDYKGLRLYGKSRGLTHTNALYLEYLDGVRVPCSA